MGLQLDKVIRNEKNRERNERDKDTSYKEVGI